MDRKSGQKRDTLFEDCCKAIDQGDILILSPEGSRGQPEQLSQLKKGLYHLHRERPDTPIIPVILRGLGRALPRGGKMLVPFNCDVIIGSPHKPQLCLTEHTEGIADIFRRRRDTTTAIVFQAAITDPFGRLLVEMTQNRIRHCIVRLLCSLHPEGIQISLSI